MEVEFNGSVTFPADAPVELSGALSRDRDNVVVPESWTKVIDPDDATILRFRIDTTKAAERVRDLANHWKHNYPNLNTAEAVD